MRVEKEGSLKTIANKSSTLRGLIGEHASSA